MRRSSIGKCASSALIGGILAVGGIRAAEPPDLPDIKDAIAGLGKGHDDEVVRQLTQLADAGEGRAWYALGLMAFNGQGMPRNYQMALGDMLAAQSLYVKVPDADIAAAGAHLGTEERKVAAQFAEAHGRAATATNIISQWQQCSAAPATGPAIKATPMRLVSPPDPNNYYPVSAARRNLAGTVTVSILMDTVGDVWDARISNLRPIKGIEELALGGLLWTAKVHGNSATVDGVPVVSRKEYRIKFVNPGQLSSAPDAAEEDKLLAAAQAGDPAAQYEYARIHHYATLTTVPGKSPNLLEVGMFIQSALGGLAVAQREMADDLGKSGCPSLRPASWSLMLRSAAGGDRQARLTVLAAFEAGSHQPPASLKLADYLKDLVDSGDCQQQKDVAFLMATAHLPSLHDPVLALDSANRALKACRSINAMEHELLLVQAAALAANGNYDAAVEAQAQAARLAAVLGKHNEVWQSILKDLQAHKWPDYSAVPILH